jgi:hypothetical protein
MLINLGDVQRAYRAQQNRNRRNGLRRFLVEKGEPSGDVFQVVIRRLFVDGSIDNFGSASNWLDGASLTERATLFSSICTDMLGGK